MVAVKTNMTARRKALKMSQLRLAREANVSRWKICLEELGEPSLTSEELLRIDNVLREELRKVSAAAQESLGPGTNSPDATASETAGERA